MKKPAPCVPVAIKAPNWESDERSSDLSDDLKLTVHLPDGQQLTTNVDPR